MKWVNGRYLVSIRRGLGMTQADLAQKLGVAQATVSRWESGLHEPTQEQWRTILGLAKPSEAPGDWSLLFMVRTARSPMILTTLDFSVLEISDRALEDEGMTRHDLVGRSLRPQFSDSLMEAFVLAEECGLFTGGAVGMVIAGAMRRLDGSQANHVSTWTPLHRADGTPLVLWQREYVTDEALARGQVSPGVQVLTIHDIFGTDGEAPPPTSPFAR